MVLLVFLLFHISFAVKNYSAFHNVRVMALTFIGYLGAVKLWIRQVSLKALAILPKTQPEVVCKTAGHGHLCLNLKRKPSIGALRIM